MWPLMTTTSCSPLGSAFRGGVRDDAGYVALGIESDVVLDVLRLNRRYPGFGQRDH
jgi:hypothetical protein